MPAEPGTPRRFGAAAVALVAVLAGIFLRLHHLSAQILGGDELHAVRAVLSEPLSSLLTTYRQTDVSMPLAALDHFFLTIGLRLSETLLRLPSLVAGLVAPLLLALGVRSALGKEDGLRGVWVPFLALLSIAPLLVIYSRVARPYMIEVLLAGGAAIAFARWWGLSGGASRHRLGWAAAYVLVAGSAAWLHLGAAPFVVAPFLFALGDLVRASHEERWLRLRQLMVLGLALLTACALFLLPARTSLFALIAGKRQPQAIPLGTWNEVGHLMAGTTQSALAGVFALLAAAGLLVLLLRHRAVALYTLTLVASQVIGIRLLSPLGLASGLVLDRYLLPVLPVVLLWVATGLWRLGSTPSAGAAAAARWSLSLGLPLALLVGGPFADPDWRASSFQLHNDLVDFARPRAFLRGMPPLAYRTIGGGSVVEIPWPPVWDFSRSFYVYQDLHGLDVRVGVAPGFLDDPRLDFLNAVIARPENLERSGARWIAVHRDLPGEEDGLGGRAHRPISAAQRTGLKQAGEGVIALLTARWGPPRFLDGGVAVWDLRARSRP